MKLRGKTNIEKVDIIMYQGIHALANNKIKKIDEELIPTFIIEEALSYFCDIEKYEVCQTIKVFFQNNPTYTVISSRDEWFGVNVKRKQNS